MSNNQPFNSAVSAEIGRLESQMHSLQRISEQFREHYNKILGECNSAIADCHRKIKELQFVEALERTLLSLSSQRSHEAAYSTRTLQMVPTTVDKIKEVMPPELWSALVGAINAR